MWLLRRSLVESSTKTSLEPSAQRQQVRLSSPIGAAPRLCS